MDIEEIRFSSPGIKIQCLWLENGILFGHKLMYGFLRARTFRKPKKDVVEHGNIKVLWKMFQHQIPRRAD